MSATESGQTATGRPLTPEQADAETRPLGDIELQELEQVVRRTSLEPGEQLGRYVVLRELGSGGMSVVYAAFDPQLDRRVALKIMRREKAPGAREAALRLKREAQALARLSHRNVVHIYDVGMVGDDVFLAMELVEGQTLRDWLKQEDRRWPDIVDVMIRAGEGLAAAHRVGLVHLDFKPSNVLIGDDGRVRVVDFGLAREPRRNGGTKDLEDSRSGESGSVELEETGTGSPRSSAHLSEPLTELGALMGTPGYIAPERLIGLEADPRSDQFSFAVTLWQALYGKRPYKGRSRRELERSVLRGRIAEPKDTHGVPPWVHRIVFRGLRRDPELRYPDLELMLEELRRDPRRRRRRWIGAAALVAAAGIGFAVHGSSAQRKLEQCRSASLDDVWSPARADALQGAFVQSGLPYAGDAYNKVAPRLEDYAGTWVDTRVDACEATHVRGDQSAELFDLRILCLDRSRRELEAVVKVLERADDKTIQNAVDTVAGLPSLATCSEPEQLRGEILVPADAQEREAIARIQISIARINALRSSGHYGEALEASEPVLEELRALDNPKLFASFVTAVAGVYTQMGLSHEAEALLEEGLWAAEESGLDRPRASILGEFVFLVGNLQGDFRRARWFAKAGYAALDRIGDAPQLRGDLMTNEAVVETLAGNHAKAIELSEQVLEFREHYGFDSSDTHASIIGNMGSAYFNAGEYDKSLQHYRRAYEYRLEVFGPRHPVIAISLENMGNALSGLGRYEESLKRHREAYELTRRAKIPEGVRFAVLLNNIAVSLHGLGRNDEAADYWGQSQEIWARYDPDHAVHAVVLCNLGEIHRARGEHLQGHERYVAALPILEKAVGPDHPYVAVALGGMGRALTDLGRAGEAVEPLERAIAIHDAVPLDPLNAAEADFQLGRALAARDGRNSKRALELIRGAQRSLEELGPKGDPIRAELDAWLDARAPVPSEPAG